jgi:hypothetical protein
MHAIRMNEASALRARESVEATALEVDALVRQGDEAVAVVEYSPDPDVRLIRNIWARKGVLERVRGVKFMWGLFACNELLHRRFGRLDSSSCSCCTGTDETPWHVIGECNGAGAVDTRICWADRMWDVLQKETAVKKGKTALRVDVANAVRRLRKVDADGRIPVWAPGTTGPLGTCLSEDDELRQLREGVAEAGSWAVWMGVFSKSWMKLLLLLEGSPSNERA